MTSEWLTATAVLRLATQLVDDIQAGVQRKGFNDIRPVHGFAFALLESGTATASDLVEHLGITKQAVAEMIRHLEAGGYLTRTVDPNDGRARVLMLTRRGRECMRAAQQTAVLVMRRWRRELGAERMRALEDCLAVISVPGRLRPAW